MGRKVNKGNDSRLDESDNSDWGRRLSPKMEIDEMMLNIHDCSHQADFSKYESFPRKYKVGRKAGCRDLARYNVGFGDGINRTLDYIKHIRREDICDKE